MKFNELIRGNTYKIIACGQIGEGEFVGLYTPYWLEVAMFNVYGKLRDGRFSYRVIDVEDEEKILECVNDKSIGREEPMDSKFSGNPGITLTNHTCPACEKEFKGDNEFAMSVNYDPEHVGDICEACYKEYLKKN